MPSSPRWLDIVRHRLRGFRAPYLVIVQHHEIPASTLLAAPITLPVDGDVLVLAPRLIIGGTEYRARLLDISAVPRMLVGDTVSSADAEATAILNAIDIILHGYPVGRPF
jgi:hypothetical protein